MAEETSIPNELKELFAKYEELKVGILSRYTQLVSAVLNGEITNENEMEEIMDGLLDYGAYGGGEQQLVRCSTAVVRSFSGS